MGSKSPEGHHQSPDASNSNALKPTNEGAKRIQRGSSSADLDQGIISNDDDDDDDDENTAPALSPAVPDAEKKKKRKRSKKKKAKSVLAHSTNLKQTTPPQVLVSALFPSGDYPIGERVPYDENISRTTDEETRYNSRLWDPDFLSNYRLAAEIHSQTRHYAQTHLIKPGASLQSIASGIEDSVRALCGHAGLDEGDALKAGMGFPTGLCLNNTACHWTPNPGQKDVILGEKDVMKVDFGVHVGGRIVDSAFTVAFDPTYDNLLASVKEATNTGIKEAGVDARMSEIGAAIQEVMESYEVEIGGKVFPVKAIRNITGHDIKRYHIHGDKQLPFVKNHSRAKMEEGEVFAIETFGSTGRGYLTDDIGVYGYGRNEEVSGKNLHLPSAKALLKTIDANFGTIVFCRRYLERLGAKSYHLAMHNLIENDIVQSYPPMSDIKGSYTAQFEHTILLHSGGKEVISRRDDY
jgi:methionyl aminopeptidase